MAKALYLLIAIIIISFGFTVWLFFKKINYFDSRLNQAISIVDDINHNIRGNVLGMSDINQLQNEIKSLQIEKESYLQMHDRESGWFIWYMTGLFAAFGVFGFAIFKYEINQIREESSQQKIEQKHQQEIHKIYIDNKINDFKIEFNELCFEVYDSIAKLNFLESMHNMNNMSKENRKDLPDVLATLIKGMEYQLKAFILCPEDKDLFESLKTGFDSLNDIFKGFKQADNEAMREYFAKNEKRNLKEINKSIDCFKIHIKDEVIGIAFNEFLYRFNTIITQPNQTNKNPV